jgi:hypothetical protein
MTATSFFETRRLTNGFVGWGLSQPTKTSFKRRDGDTERIFWLLD